MDLANYDIAMGFKLRDWFIQSFFMIMLISWRLQYVFISSTGALSRSKQTGKWNKPALHTYNTYFQPYLYNV